MRRYILIIIIILLIVGGSIFILCLKKNYTLPIYITYQNTEYIAAHCITPKSLTIKKIGQTNDGIDVFGEEKIINDKEGQGILLKNSFGAYQCYIKNLWPK
ncbi:MAG: hypothetical protein Q7R95_04110 [bacterium]|nr:hypothetical protein [bacterium]